MLQLGDLDVWKHGVRWYFHYGPFDITYLGAKDHLQLKEKTVPLVHATRAHVPGIEFTLLTANAVGTKGIGCVRENGATVVIWTAIVVPEKTSAMKVDAILVTAINLSNPRAILLGTFATFHPLYLVYQQRQPRLQMRTL